jgi:hypothetical protein
MAGGGRSAQGHGAIENPSYDATCHVYIAKNENWNALGFKGSPMPYVFPDTAHYDDY